MAIRIIAATPVLITPASVPHRHVLVEKTHDTDYPKKLDEGYHWRGGDISEYVVWTETFSEKDHTKHTGYHSGFYVRVDAQEDKDIKFVKAYKAWLEKANSVNEYIDWVGSRFQVC